ncbi:hypothetical protein [Aquibacillus kalidii]|uniref:hypothetical protein n=1 Tax=Aquibacillus kalidii TaxID=2762597 RepID=UPI0016446D00|nr:hypothetical protein [Aquibacillus kalidii]
MDTLINLVTDNSIIGIIVVIIAISLIVGVIKSLFKMAITVAVIGLVLVVFFNFNPKEIINSGKDIAHTGSQIFDGSQYLMNLSETDFIKEENGETIVEIAPLGIKYNIEKLLTQIGSETKETNPLKE